MELSKSILFSYTLTKNKKFQKDKSIKEIAAFFLGILTIESKFLKHDEVGEGYWIVRFEEFITNYLNSELNHFKEDWKETIGTSYSEWIYQHQKDDLDGLNKFYHILNEFVRQEMNPLKNATNN